MQPGFCHGPVALDGSRRNSKNFRRIFNRKSGKESQFYNPALLRVELREIAEGLIEGNDIHFTLAGSSDLLVERDPIHTIPALASFAATCVVDQDAPHHLSSNAEKRRAILPAHVLIDKA